jgi:hypothetical protein
MAGALAAVEAVGALASGDLDVAPLQSYFNVEVPTLRTV